MTNTVTVKSMNTSGKRVGCHTKLMYEVMTSVATSEDNLFGRM